MTRAPGASGAGPVPRLREQSGGPSQLQRRQVSRTVGSGQRTFATIVVALLVLVAVIAVQAAASSFLWRVTGPRGGTIYLGGSLHLLTTEYYPLAPAFDDAFAQSDLLVEELDMAEMLAPDAQMLMLQRGMMPAGQTLDQVLSAATLASVKAKVAELGLPLAPLQLFKPWALALTLQGLEWQKAGYDPELGLDRHFYDRAKETRVQVQGLETLAFQIGQFDSLPMPLQDRMLAETLEEMATAKDDVGKLARAWKAGDAAAIEEAVLSDLKSEPEMYRRLLV
ncbi:MAG TPA: TraB/GumN family protein, partial [Vicinamibacterales bacterium]|nr:TraB/GumN family protein [Vicinamibacterales bacterium]